MNISIIKYFRFCESVQSWNSLSTLKSSAEYSNQLHHFYLFVLQIEVLIQKITMIYAPFKQSHVQKLLMNALFLLGLKQNILTFFLLHIHFIKQ